MTKKETPKEIHVKPILHWVAKEYVKHSKGTAWVATAALILAAFIAYAILNHSWSMAVAFFVVGVVYYLHHKQEPKNVDIAISELGIHVGSQDFLFSHMRAFWIIYDPPFVKTLHIRFSKKSVADLVVQLGDENPVPIRNFLLSQLPEWEGKEEAPFDAIARLLKL